MKIILSIFFLSFGFFANAQHPNKKRSTDSARYYRTELNKFWKVSTDSIKNSDKFKYLKERIDKNKEKVVTVELLVHLGGYFTDFKNLNSRLKSIGQAEIKNLVPSLGASLAIGHPLVTYGFEIAAYTFENKNASFRGIHGRIYLGTNLLKKSPVVLHPQIGFASSLLNMYITRPLNQTNFNDLFITQSNSVQLSHTMNYLDLAMGLKLRNRKFENFYWQVLRLGYRMGLKDKAWKMRGGQINDSPKDKNNQFYVQLCLGFDRE